MDCIFYSFLDWLHRFGDDGKRQNAAVGGMGVAAMWYGGSISSLLHRAGVQFDYGFYPTFTIAVVMVAFCFLRYIARDQFKQGLVRFRSTSHSSFCSRAYLIILLSPLVLAISVYIKFAT
jgi:hypothetical protein